MTRRPSLSALVILVGAFGLTLCRPPTPTVAKVEIVTGAAVMAGEDTVKEVLGTFDRAEKAIQAKDSVGLRVCLLA